MSALKSEWETGSVSQRALLNQLKPSDSIDSNLEVGTMAAVTVRNLDDQVKERLRVRAAVHGRSMESEIRAILAEAVSRPGVTDGLFATMLERFAGIGGVELDLPERSTPVRAPDLSA